MLDMFFEKLSNHLVEESQRMSDLEKKIIELQEQLNKMQQPICIQHHCDCCRYKLPFAFTAPIKNNTDE